MYLGLIRWRRDYHVIQADETPVLVNRDGRPSGSKSYMWVYRSGHLYKDKQIVLYDYHKTRNSFHPREFLKNYSGICVTDGYQVYHKVEKECEDLRIAGCWVHARRKFDEAMNVVSKEQRNKSNAYLVMKQIQAIYREEGKLEELLADDRHPQRRPFIRNHLQHCRNSKGKQPKTVRLLRISLRRDTEASG